MYLKLLPQRGSWSPQGSLPTVLPGRISLHSDDLGISSARHQISPLRLGETESLTTQCLHGSLNLGSPTPTIARTADAVMFIVILASSDIANSGFRQSSPSTVEAIVRSSDDS